MLSALPHPTTQPLAYLYLSQIPYTGLDLGFWGTIVYWIMLIGWSLAAAYLVLFGVLPYIVRKGQAFGLQVVEVLNETPRMTPVFAPAPLIPPVTPYTPPVMNRVADVPAPPRVGKPEAPGGPAGRYSTYHGFKSFASGDALTIDDIVKGLARSHSVPAAQNVEPVYENVEPIYDEVEPIYENVDSIEEPDPVLTATAAPAQAAPAAAKMAAPRPPLAQAPVAVIAPEVPSFIESLFAGNREAVFGALRATVRSGADTEAFLTQIACALDDAYRARLEGTPVHPEIRRLTAPLATPVLEKLVTALSTAVDSSYSVGITGAKLALTRALAILNA